MASDQARQDLLAAQEALARLFEGVEELARLDELAAVDLTFSTEEEEVAQEVEITLPPDRTTGSEEETREQMQGVRNWTRLSYKMCRKAAEYEERIQELRHRGVLHRQRITQEEIRKAELRAAVCRHPPEAQKPGGNGDASWLVCRLCAIRLSYVAFRDRVPAEVRLTPLLLKGAARGDGPAKGDRAKKKNGKGKEEGDE